MGIWIFGVLTSALLLTLVAELTFALLWRIKRRDLPLVALANLITNPAVVLCHYLARIYAPSMALPVTILLELGAVAAEGYLYRSRGKTIRRPCLFALCANALSYGLGLILF